ncbi:MAG: carboxypeptidase M32 [Lachnospiraceae bacterium]|nr:carboxypeptidase M32 [Lachnospiraceae bacterium]
MKNQELFEKYQAYYGELRKYAFAASRIQWDIETVAPKNAVKRSVEAFTFLRTKAFGMKTAPEYGEMLEALSDPETLGSLPPGWAYTVTSALREYRDFIHIPTDFYEKTVRDRALSGRAWQEAKQSGDYMHWAPFFAQEIANAKETSRFTDPGKDVYDALIGRAEPGMDCAAVDKVFTELREGLASLLPRILEKPAWDLSAFDRHYDIAHEREACLYLLRYVGFDFESGRMDEVEHPLTAGTGRNDVRVSNHFFEDDGIGPLFSIIHEGGHGLFSQGVSEELEGTDAEFCKSAGLNEGMARFMENIVGRNIQFWAPVYSDIQKIMPELTDIPLSLFYKKINDVRPGCIRMRADEVTYCMHIILRHELEKRLFREELDVRELPGLWNDKMEEYLGIRPENDREGILQDLHWSSGFLGYFPTYLLGSIYDGMFLDAMEQELGPIGLVLARDGVPAVTGWLRKNIYQYGGLYTSPEQIARITKKPLSAAPLLRYFTNKYTEIYSL